MRDSSYKRATNLQPSSPRSYIIKKQGVKRLVGEEAGKIKNAGGKVSGQEGKRKLTNF
jgi:hypothetical protein